MATARLTRSAGAAARSEAKAALPIKAQMRIEKLESTVKDLTEALSVMVDAMHDQGVNVSIAGKNVSPLTRKMFTVRTQRRGPARAPSAHGAAADRSLGPPRVAEGEAARLAWVSGGEVVPVKDLANRWGLTPQALSAAAKRGELFAVMVKAVRYFPSEFLRMKREDVTALCVALQPLDAEDMLFFFKRKHGALAGRTVLEALGSRDPSALKRAVALALATSEQARQAADLDAA